MSNITIAANVQFLQYLPFFKYLRSSGACLNQLWALLLLVKSSLLLNLLYLTDNFRPCLWRHARSSGEGFCPYCRQAVISVSVVGGGQGERSDSQRSIPPVPEPGLFTLDPEFQI